MKKGFFFTFDAILALGVLVVAFLLILSTFYHRPEEKQTEIYSDNLMDLFATTQVNEVQENTVFRMWCSRCPGRTGEVTNPENTLLEQMGEFYYKNDLNSAETIARSISRGLIKPQFSYALYINGTEIYNLSKRSEENASLLITSKRLVYGLLDHDIWGPYIAEVRVWK